MRIDVIYRLIKFIGLKVAEIGGFLLIFYLCGVVYRIYIPNESYIMSCIMGFLWFAVIVLGLGLVYLLGRRWVEKNWEWAE